MFNIKFVFIIFVTVLFSNFVNAQENINTKVVNIKTNTSNANNVNNANTNKDNNKTNKIVFENDFLVLINSNFDNNNPNKNNEEFNLLKTFLAKQNKQTKRSEYRKIVTDILATEGYFLPDINFQRNKENKKLNISVSLDNPTMINNINIAFQNENGVYLDHNSAKYQELINNIPLKTNNIFKQTDWNNTKQIILNNLLQSEYYEANLENSLADVDSENNKVNIYLFYKTGYSYKLGNLKITGLYRYDENLVHKYNYKIIQNNDVYSIKKFNELQNELQNTPYFSSVKISLDTENSKAINNTENVDSNYQNFLQNNQKIADVIIEVREKAAHNLAFGIGYSTNTGARLDNRYQTANFLNKSLSLETAIFLEQKRQTILADLFLPQTENRHKHGLGMILEHSDIEGLNIRRYAIGWQNIIQKQHLETRWSIMFLKENYTTATTEFLNLTRNTQALVPNVQWTWRNVDDPLNPTDGNVLRFQVGIAAKGLLSDTNFVRMHMKGMHFYSINNNNILTFSYELGKTINFSDKSNKNSHNYSNNKIPQDYLFRTGGTGSIRGYSYQNIGIRSGSATLGAKNLAVSSVQLLHWITPQWGGVVFADAGNAWDDNSTNKEKKIAVGYGIGARWKSPAGPLGIDLAYGEREKNLQLHFALNIPF